MLFIHLNRPLADARKYVQSLASSRPYPQTIESTDGPPEVKFLGHILTADGIRIGENRVKAIVDFPTPKTLEEMQSVLGMVNFVHAQVYT